MQWSYDALDWVYGLVGRFGLPLAIAAWLTVAGCTAGMLRVLRRYDLRPHWIPGAIFGVIALTAHVSDTAITLHVSPDLAVEANPLWRAIVDTFGLRFAIVYGISGKILLSVLCLQAYLFYAPQRRELYPADAAGFRDFWRKFGNGERVRRLLNVFAYLFAFIAPFTFYIVLLNALIESPWWDRLPPMPLALAAYLVGLVASYFWFTWQDYLRVRRVALASA